MQNNFLNLNELTLMLTSNCNLRCRYCYENKKDVHMSREVIKKSIDFLNRNTRYEHPVVSIFGGEPFLTPDTLKFSFDYAIKKNPNVRFKIITNGTILNRKIRFLLRKYKAFIVGFHLSMDCNQKMHDAYRVYPSGAGSWADIKRNLPFFLQLFPDLTVQARFDARKTKKSDLVKFVKELGHNRINSVSIFPIAETISSNNCSFLLSEYLNLAKWHREKDNKAMKYISQLRPIYLKSPSGGKVYPCSAGKGLLFIDSDGSIFPCIEFWIAQREKLGSIHKPNIGKIALFQRTLTFKYDDKKKYYFCAAKHKKNDGNLYTNSINRFDYPERLFLMIILAVHKEQASE